MYVMQKKTKPTKFWEIQMVELIPRRNVCNHKIPGKYNLAFEISIIEIDKPNLLSKVLFLVHYWIKSNFIEVYALLNN